jgi:F-type H+-transporting ATPase subunit delta
MSDKNLAFPYSKAFLDLSIQENRLDLAHKDMQSLSKIGEENPELKLALQNPLIPLVKKKNILLQVMGNLSPATLKLLELLIEKERPGLVFTVADEFARLYREYLKIQAVEITTAQVIKPELEKEILAHLEKALAGKIEMTKKVDPELIGGLMIRIGDKRYDGTIRKSLLEVKKNLMEKRFHN